jgi:hypothetical protein
MLQESEVLSLILFVGALVFLLWNRRKLIRLPALNVLTASLSVLVIGRVLTNLEDFFWTASLNLAEHVCYAAGALLLVVWFYRVFGKAAAGR